MTWFHSLIISLCLSYELRLEPEGQSSLGRIFLVVLGEADCTLIGLSGLFSLCLTFMGGFICVIEMPLEMKPESMELSIGLDCLLCLNMLYF